MTAIAVLIGQRIDYSASPAIHSAAFAALGLESRYELRDVGVDGLADEVVALRAGDRIGANVTQAHKVAVCDMVDELGPEVCRLGAANAIVRYDGRLVARNTLVREARAAGARARGGAGMLLRQAALSFSLWTDREAPIDVMREAMRRELGPAADG